MDGFLIRGGNSLIGKIQVGSSQSEIEVRLEHRTSQFSFVVSTKHTAGQLEEALRLFIRGDVKLDCRPANGPNPAG